MDINTRLEVGMIQLTARRFIFQRTRSNSLNSKLIVLGLRSSSAIPTFFMESKAQLEIYTSRKRAAWLQALALNLGGLRFKTAAAILYHWKSIL
jgi:hypothetical protein